jgi:SAM-dependent methyltransferase
MAGTAMRRQDEECESPGGERLTMSQGSQMFAEAAAYEQFMGRWSRLLAPMLITFASVGGRDSILDVGSGTGELAFALANGRSAVEVIGVDRSDAYVQYAQARTLSDRVRFVVGDAGALQFAADTFDKTLSSLALNFVPNPGRAVGEMIRVTRPGGVVAATVWDYAEGMEMLRVFWDEAVALEAAADARDERQMPLCKRGELESLWRASGLEAVEGHPLVFQLSFDSFQDYWQPFLRGQGPAGAYVAALPPTKRIALERRLLTRLLNGRRDAPFTLQARAWAAKGRKPLKTLPRT